MQSGARQLQDWLKRRGFQQKEAAAAFGISEPYVSYLLDGSRLPGRELAVKIERMTGITVSSWTLNPVDIGVGGERLDGRKRSA